MLANLEASSLALVALALAILWWSAFLQILQWQTLGQESTC